MASAWAAPSTLCVVVKYSIPRVIQDNRKLGFQTRAILVVARILVILQVTVFAESQAPQRTLGHSQQFDRACKLAVMSKTSPTVGSIKVLYDLPQVTIRTRSVSEMDNNVYLITSKTTGSQVLIDAADDPDAIMELLESAADDTPCDLDLVSLITTHE